MKKPSVFLFTVLFLASVACSLASPKTDFSEMSSKAISTTDSGIDTLLTVQASVALNLRNVPDAAGPIDSSVLLRMPGGAEVVWLNKCQGPWAKVRYKEQAGWAISYLLDPAVCQ